MLALTRVCSPGGTLADLRPTLSVAFAGRYVIERELGRGATAIVYQARDLDLSRSVAVKVLRPEFVESTGAARFLREIRITARLQHPLILRVLDSGTVDNQLYFVLPYMDGGTLRDRLNIEKQLPIEEALVIAKSVASALIYAHQQGLIHRDVKPENILFTEGQACLADFGIARAIELASTDRTTSTGVVRGTPAYMSPEQAAGEGRFDGRSDIYSLGCVLYEMVAGVQPFVGPSSQSVLSQRLAHDPRPLRVYRPSVPPSLERAIERSMMRQPADRYQTVGELYDALSSVSTGASLGSEEQRWTENNVVDVAARRRRRLAARLLSTGAVLAATIAVGWIATRSRTPALDSNKILVLPFVERGKTGPTSPVGDEIALLIGSALEHTEPLKWIDGWTWLDSAQRANPSRLTARQAGAIARSRGARFYLEGSVLQRADSATVITRLVDVDGDSVFAQNSATGPSGESIPLLGLRAAVRLLPLVVDPTRHIDLRPILDRNPAAVASFLQGEREYRKSHFVSALAHYRRAVEEDSGLAFAALKGAQAANWADSNSKADPLIKLALSRESLLPAKYAQFAHGLDAFLRGSADSASASFRRALALDSDWSEAWSALGEVYFHLFPAGEALDSVAEASFERARRADRDFAPPVFHLTELALRSGQLDRAETLLQDFRRFEPDSGSVIQLELTVECARGKVNAAGWRRWARRYPIETANAAKSLALLAQRYDCAEDGFRAVLAADSVPLSGRWMATFGAQSLLLAKGRATDARHLLDSVVASGMRQSMSLYIVDAAAGFDGAMGDAAKDAMKLVAGRYEAMPAYRLWYNAVWEASQGNTKNLMAIASAARAQAARTGADEDRFIASVVAANLALVRGDSAEAIRLLSSVRPAGAAHSISWGLWEPAAAERLSLARLLLARHDFQAAIRVADTFDHSQPAVDLIFLPASLMVRVQAAEGLRNPKLQRRYREQLSLLGRTDLLTSSR